MSGNVNLKNFNATSPLTFKNVQREKKLRFSFSSREIVKSAAHKKKHEFKFKSHEFIFGEAR